MSNIVHIIKKDVSTDEFNLIEMLHRKKIVSVSHNKGTFAIARYGVNHGPKSQLRKIAREESKK